MFISRKTHSRVCNVLFGALLTIFAPIPAEANGELPYVKITINNANNAVIGGRRVGFLRPIPDTFDNNVYNFNGLQVKQVTNNGGTILDLQASQQTLAWVRVFFGQGIEWDVYSFDKGAAKNVSKTPEVIEDGLNVGGRNIVWTAFDSPDDTYHVYRNQGANTVAITEGFMPGVFRLRGAPRASESDNIVWNESLDGSVAYYDADDDEIRIIVDPGPEGALSSFYNISGHRVALIIRDVFGILPASLKLYNGNTEETEVLAEEGGPLGAPVIPEDYDHPDLVWQAAVDVGSGIWLTNVSTGETIDFVDAVAPFVPSGIPEVSDGFASFLGTDTNGNIVVAIYDIDRDKVRVIASYPPPPDGNKFPENLHISGPNLVWTLPEFFEEGPPFVKGTAVVAYRLDEYIKILFNL